MTRILLVEDEMLVRELMYEDLRESGFAVTPIATGDEALRVIDTDTAFDLLLTDIRMPGETDGWTLGRRARQVIPSIRVIYATGYTDHGGDLYAHERTIKKPFRHEQILALIRELDVQR
ncbi:MAG: response regulator [Sphingomonadales bacterium]|nr:response regulator [Sphingomonadales bacterium]